MSGPELRATVAHWISTHVMNLVCVLQNKLRVLTTAWGHVMLIAAFAAFVVLNGGVAVGDRDAHRPTLHLAQLSYFSLFAAAAFSPLLMGSSM